MKTKIEIRNIKNTMKLESWFTSNLVDIAYIDRIDNDTAYIILDEGIDTKVQIDRDWLNDLIAIGLNKCGELDAKILFIK